MNTMTLAEALRVTAKRIEDRPDDYSWGRCDSCNCGQLFQTITGMGEGQLSRFRYDSVEGARVWSKLAEYSYAVCPVVNLPINSVIRVLREFGMTMLQVRELENLSNAKIRAMAGLSGSSQLVCGLTKAPYMIFLDSGDTVSVIAYMRAWATMLDEQVSESLNVSEPAPASA